MKKQALVTSFLLSMVVATAALAGSVTVLCADGSTWRGSTDDQVTVQYTDGGVKVEVTGVLTQAEELFIVVKKSDGSGEVPIYRPDIIDITKADAAGATAAPKPSAAPSGQSTAGDAGSTQPDDESSDTTVATDGKGVFYLPLTGTVGMEFRPEEIEAIIAQADEAGPGQTIVLDIESGGGSVWEFIVLAEIIKEASERHQFVAWVGHSISAAAGTALCCSRLFWKPHGALGAITMHSGGRPVPDHTEERWVTMLQSLLDSAGHSRHWARPMVRNDSYISFVKDENGECEFFNTPQGMSGEKVLSNLGENVVLNRDIALECCLAENTARTKEELAEFLDMPSWKEMGTGQKLHDDWMNTIERCQKFLSNSAIELELAPEKGPMGAINAQIKIYQRMISWWRRAPNVMRGSAPPVEQLEQMIEQLKLQLRQMNAGRG